VRAGAVHPGSSFWQLAFEGVLMELLDAHSQVCGPRGEALSSRVWHGGASGCGGRSSRRCGRPQPRHAVARALQRTSQIQARGAHPAPVAPALHTPRPCPFPHTQVHSECLRLLLLVAKDVPAAALAAHLELMLAATRESRATARHRKHKYHERCGLVSLHPPFRLGPPAGRARAAAEVLEPPVAAHDGLRSPEPLPRTRVHSPPPPLPHPHPPRSEARARKEAEEFEQLAGDYLFSAGGGGLQSEWSDGFRAVRSLKYGTDENFSDLYKKVIFVGGLAEASLPEAVRAFLHESRAEREGGRKRGRAPSDGGGDGRRGEDDEEGEGARGGGGPTDDEDDDA
jgi:hypothetical protein